MGFKHSEETRVKQSVANKGENNPMYGKKREHSEETRAKQSAANKGENNPYVPPGENQTCWSR